MYLLRLFSSVNVDDLVLIHIFKDVWGIHQDANGANRCDKEEHVELQSIDYHSHKLPVFSYLKKQEKNGYAIVPRQGILNKFIEIKFTAGCMVWP